MSEQQHTPLRYDGHGLNSADEYASRLLTFARKPASDGGEYVLERADQDALGAFIVRAVNSHAALVDALLAVERSACAGVNNPAAQKGALKHILDETRAALKAAGVSS